MMLKVLLVSLLVASSHAYPFDGGKCTNSADAAAWAKHKGTFASDLATCGKKCLGGADCVSKCIATADGYSADCSSCFGALTGCTKTHCMLKCINGNSPACTACVKQNHCDTDFVSCSGVTPPSPAPMAVGATPSGTYSGEDKFFGVDIKASLHIDDTTHMDLDISPPASISCKGETYTLAGSSVTVPGATKPGDCIHDALAKISASLKDVSYDASSDSIKVVVKKIIDVTLTLKKSATPAIEVSLIGGGNFTGVPDFSYRKCHFDDPFQPAGCLADEMNVTVQGVKGSFCAPKCDASGSCPTDVCPGTVAKPTCALQDGTGQKFCALLCHPKSNGTSVCSSDEHMTCQPIQSTGLCTYYS